MPTIVSAASLSFAIAMFGCLAACGDASNPAELRAGHPGAAGTSTDAPSATDPTPQSGSAMNPGTGGGTGGSSGTNGAGAADAGTDSATVTPPPPADVFTGAPAYANVAGRATTNGSHPNGGTATGAACFTCHGKGEFSMVMGGTVYTDAAGTTPASNVEVVLKVGATFFSANTNANGNFVVPGPVFAGSAKVGVRNGAAAHAMSGAITSGDCNSCHNGTTTSRIHLP